MLFYNFRYQSPNELDDEVKIIQNYVVVTVNSKTKVCLHDHKLYWRPLNWKRSLPVLKWTSESEYFFCRHYIYNPVQEQSLYPFAAHARRGVKIWLVGPAVLELCCQQ